MKLTSTLVFILSLVSLNALAGDAGYIRLSCSNTVGNNVTLVDIENGSAVVRSYDKRMEGIPTIVGGPYNDLETFGGDVIGVKTAIDDSFSLYENSLTYKSNLTGKIEHVQDMNCSVQ